MSIRKLTLLVLILLASAAPAQAKVVITFYSHSLGTYGFDIAFPHGYVTLTGTTENGQAVKANFGFTAPDVSPAMLWGPVDGRLDTEPDDYIAEGKPHFSLAISDTQYRAVLAVIEKWRNAAQPSYDLDSRNCVTFVKEIAVAVGLAVSDDKKFIHAPNDFLNDVATRNAALLAQARQDDLKASQASIAAAPVK